MDGLGFGGQRMGDAVFNPLWMNLFVLPRKKTRFIILIIDIIGIVIEQNLSLAVSYECVDDAFFGGGQGIEAGENDAPMSNL